jgi:hypothetical protein
MAQDGNGRTLRIRKDAQERHGEAVAQARRRTVIRCGPMPSPTWRAALALLMFSAWMGLLFGGFLLGGALHLLLLGAAALFPWRSLPPPMQ